MRLLLIIYGLLDLTPLCQQDGVETTMRLSSYYDNQFNIVYVEEYTINNKSGAPVFTWIDFKSSIDSSPSSRQKAITKYFYDFKGDFNFINLLSDVDDFYSNYLGCFFLKKISPGSSFKYVVITKESSCQMRYSLKEHIFVERADTLLGGFLNQSYFESKFFAESFVFIMDP